MLFRRPWVSRSTRLRTAIDLRFYGYRGRYRKWIPAGVGNVSAHLAKGPPRSLCDRLTHGHILSFYAVLRFTDYERRGKDV